MWTGSFLFQSTNGVTRSVTCVQADIDMDMAVDTTALAIYVNNSV